MKQLGREILIGMVPAVLLFFVFMGVNVLPVLFIAAIGVGLFYMLKSRGQIPIGAGRFEQHGEIPQCSFDDIGGQERAKRELKEALDFLISPAEVEKFGIRPLKGVLLTGPPGTGKTLLAKAAANYTDSVFVSASGSEFVEMYVGVGAGRIRDLFKQARQLAQKKQRNSAVIFIDEIDVIGGKREGGQHREYDQTLNQLLTEMDGIRSSDSPRILLMAATNRKEMLDSALLRPGRFDRIIEVDIPDKKGRLHILQIHSKNKPLEEEVSLEKVAEETFGFSGAQLESVMNEAAIYAMREKAERISQKHLSQAIDKVMMGEQTDKETTQEERKRVAVHELGHAIVAEVLRPGTVSQVSLRGRGPALGYVRHNSTQDRYLYTKRHIEEQIMIALGGAAAEEIYYGERSTGSKNDFEQAMHLVRMMIEAGLSSLGIVHEKMLTKEDWMNENKKILNRLFEKTRTLLENHIEVCNRGLDILTKEEVLSGEQFRKLMSSHGKHKTA